MKLGMRMLRVTLAALYCLFMAMPVVAFEISGLKAKPIKGGEHVTIRISEKIEPDVTLAEHSPPRVVIDLPTARWKKGKKEYTSDIIKDVRLATHDEETSRLVLELMSDAKLQQVKLTGNKRKGYAIEFDLLADSEVTEKKKAAQFQPTEKPVIVIDAGHGGQDPGASGLGGVKEKKVTLRFAEALKEALSKSGRYKVVMTRSDDRYLFLKERVQIARAAKGSLFISLHADSAPSRTASGLSVYTISEKASDKESEALAAKENKADVIGGIDLSNTDEDVADILIDLAERETRGKSAQFAKQVIRSLSREIQLLSNTHRYAGFAVLKAPDIPSILVEVGFLSSPQEERLLESDSYRKKVARGLANAVDAYFSKKKK